MNDFPNGVTASFAEGSAPQVEMPRYVSHKQVWALEIATVGPIGNLGRRQLSFRDPGYATIEAPNEMFSRYTPVPGDFYVVYPDGYKSFSPRKAFLEGYTKVAADSSVPRGTWGGGSGGALAG